MNQSDLPEARVIDMAPGDILGLISDGVYEYENEAGAQFGQDGLARVFDANKGAPMADLVQLIMQAAYDHGGSVPQADDITIVLIRRLS